MTKRETEFAYGDEVTFMWGLVEVRGTVREVYGSPPLEHVVILLTPEVSGPCLLEEPTTVSLPIGRLKKVEPVS